MSGGASVVPLPELQKRAKKKSYSRHEDSKEERRKALLKSLAGMDQLLYDNDPEVLKKNIEFNEIMSNPFHVIFPKILPDSPEHAAYKKHQKAAEDFKKIREELRLQYKKEFGVDPDAWDRNRQTSDLFEFKDKYNLHAKD